ncbi:MAG: hypothetical protein HZB22_05950 [Deltaproteobacteria bacterium]|nr:hypothetical protein [Deltaproteobacteria bacterium]
MKASSKKTLKHALLFSLSVFLGLAYTGSIDTASAAQKAKSTDAAQKSDKEAASSTSTVPKLDPSDPTSVIYLDTSGKPAGVGDPNRPPSVAYQAGKGWHPAALSVAGLPKDRYGLIDWAKLVREKLIKPRFSLDPNDEEMEPLQMDILIPAKGDYVNDVIYPHEMHTYWLKCEVCHPKIFIPAKGQNNMTMVGIVQGQWCGRCHGKVSFPLTDCNRCHVSPKKKAAGN